MTVSPTPVVTPASSASGLNGGDWAQIVQVVLLFGGGLWAFYLYRISRRGQTTVGIRAKFSLVMNTLPNESLLLVAMRIANSSTALFRHEKSLAVLMDASQRAADGSVLLVPFAEQDPFLPVYGQLSGNPDEIAAGKAFTLDPPQYIILEPGESVDCSLAFPLRTSQLGLLALRRPESLDHLVPARSDTTTNAGQASSSSPS